VTPRKERLKVSPRIVSPTRWRWSEVGIYALVACGTIGIGINAIESLRARGIHAGLGFLWDTAGFDIGFALIPYDATKSYARAFLVGLLNTLFVSALASSLALMIGLGLAVARLSASRLLRAGAGVLIEVTRNTPLLLQLSAWYFLVFGALPSVRQSLGFAGVVIFNNRGVFVASPQLSATWLVLLIGLTSALLALTVTRSMSVPFRPKWAARLLATVYLGVLASWVVALLGAEWKMPRVRGFNVVGGVNIPPELLALLVALAIYGAAFVAEAFRSAFLAVPEGQWESARALGLQPFFVLRLVVLPQALRIAAPPLANHIINVVKASSLAAAVGFPDLMQVFAKTTLNQTGQAVEVITITLIVYLLISLGISMLARQLEKGSELS
jgi:general L-amino acid transport system permease protein